MVWHRLGDAVDKIYLVLWAVVCVLVAVIGTMAILPWGIDLSLAGLQVVRVGLLQAHQNDHSAGPSSELKRTKVCLLGCGM